MWLRLYLRICGQRLERFTQLQLIFRSCYYVVSQYGADNLKVTNLDVIKILT